MAATLGNYSEPFVNGATLKRLYSSVVKDNIFQDLFTRDGEACTEKYCEDTSVAQVTVLRILPGLGAARTMNSSVNGGFFNNADPIFNETVAYSINLLDLVDFMIDIPEVQQDMMSTDLAATRAKILGGQVAAAVNAMTIAAQLGKNFNDVYNGSVDKNWVELAASPAAGDYLAAIIDAGAALDDGNAAEGIQTYPKSERALFVRAAFKAKLFKPGQLIVGGSNYGQQMIADGGLNPGAKSDNVTGFSGVIDDTPTYLCGGAVWNMVETYLGLNIGALADVQALLVSGIGTGRGLAFNSTITQINCPRGPGVRMQPLYRFGAQCWDALSVVPIVANGFTNPGTGALSAIAPRSRTFTITYNKNGGTSTTAADTGIAYGATQALASNGFTAPQGKEFKGWSLKSTATAAAAKAAGTNVVVDANYIYYAIWG